MCYIDKLLYCQELIGRFGNEGTKARRNDKMMEKVKEMRDG